jgi:hypothetical protein
MKGDALNIQNPKTDFLFFFLLKKKWGENAKNAFFYFPEKFIVNFFLIITSV